MIDLLTPLSFSRPISKIAQSFSKPAFAITSTATVVDATTISAAAAAAVATVFAATSRKKSDVIEVYDEEKVKIYKLLDGLSFGNCKKKILAFRKMPYPHDGETLFSFMKEMILDWNLDKKLFSIVVDNATNDDVMIRKVKDWILYDLLVARDVDLLVRNKLVNLFIDYEGSCAISVNESNVISSLRVETRDSLSDFDRWRYESRVSNNRKSELKKYLEEARFSRVETFNILDWWKTNSPRLLVLAKITRDILAVPATTVALEAAFSVSGRIIDESRMCLLPDAVEALVVADDWIESIPKRNNTVAARERVEFRLKKGYNTVAARERREKKGSGLDPIRKFGSDRIDPGSRPNRVGSGRGWV
ncbi:UNVERIFIED_CONTAM: hypothetical protein Scaly_1002400 [Sesamum calycinum]|uniref:HAT C-terminal dimerisation domain-containing protein n=1 Tax=Sesamum calycinum TaxID=2727403 RepID=A0AAW2R0D1_9LAMI